MKKNISTTTHSLLTALVISGIGGLITYHICQRSMQKEQIKYIDLDLTDQEKEQGSQSLAENDMGKENIILQDIMELVHTSKLTKNDLNKTEKQLQKTKEETDTAMEILRILKGETVENEDDKDTKEINPSDQMVQQLLDQVKLAGKQPDQDKLSLKPRLLNHQEIQTKPIQTRKRRVRKKEEERSDTTIPKQPTVKLQPVQWDILEVIGKEGVSRIKTIEEIISKKGKYSVTTVRSAIAPLKTMDLIDREMVKTPFGGFGVCMLTDLGEKVFREKFDQTAVPSEAEILIKEHDNLTHGYGIRQITDILKDKEYFTEVTDITGREMIKTKNGSYYVPDIIAVCNGEKIYFEYECMNNTQRYIESKCIRMFDITPTLNFIVPNRDDLEKMATQIERWFSHRKKGSLEGITIRITTARQLKSHDLREDKGWQYVYHSEGVNKPEINF